MGKINVLLIEDNILDADLISGNLLRISREHKIGFALERAEKLSEVVIRAAEKQYDIILTDLELPDSSGIDTFVSIQSTIPGTPIIVLTGLDDEDVALYALTQGAQDYLLKGVINGELLLKSIRYSIERHKIRMELNARIAENYRLEQERAKMLSMFAHDIKNALVPSVGFLKRILSGKTEKMQDRLEEVIDNLMSVEHLTKNFLDFANLKAKNYYPRPSPCDLDAIIRKEVDNAQVAAEMKSITILYERPEKVFVLNADSVMIKRVIMNLLNNAVKYTDAGGLVIVGLTENDMELRIEIRDSGSGISPDDLPFVFDAFYRASRNQAGTGLGLAISKTIIDAHGGKLWVNSTPGMGSIFGFSLPKSLRSNNKNSDMA